MWTSVRKSASWELDLQPSSIPPFFMLLLGTQGGWGSTCCPADAGQALSLLEKESSKAWVLHDGGATLLATDGLYLRFCPFKVTVIWGLCYLQLNGNSDADTQGEQAAGETHWVREEVVGDRRVTWC